MIVYGSTFSPYVRKVIAVAAEKRMEIELVPTGIGDPNPDFVAASPLRKMPALRDGDYTLADSSAIVHYLEAKQPDPPMIPAEAKARGRTIWWEEWSDTILMSVGAKIFFNRVVAPVFLQRGGDLAAADAAQRDELPGVLDYLERELPAEGWLVGDFSLADIAVAGPLVNLGYCGCAVDSAHHPKAAAFLARVTQRPSIAPVIAREAAILASVRGS